MRIAWVIRGDLAQPTGGYIYDRLVVDGLRACGNEVDVIGLASAPRTSEAARTDLVKQPALRIAQQRSDVVIGDALCASELGPLFDRLGGKAPRLLLVHHLTSWEMERAHDNALRAEEAHAVAASDALVATSPASAARLRNDHAVRRVDVAAPGCDRLPRYPRATNARPPVELLFVGSIVARKQLPLILDAIERLADLPLSLTLLGDAGREPEHARAIAGRVAASPVLRAAVTTCGVVDDDALARRLARAHALVLPSSLEGYGIVLAEALRAGLPVLASRAAAHAAGIEGSGGALVFDDAPALVDSLLRLVQDTSRLATMQTAAEKTVLPRWQETVRIFQDVIDRLTAPRAVRAPALARGQ
jgi:glycosyltransferase involved in cell wall biosynthesis